MAGGTKRAADDSAEGSAKVAKTPRTAKNGNGTKSGAKGAAAKTALSSPDFKAKAMPLHVHLTHTPPSIQKEGNIDADGKVEKDVGNLAGDVGFIGNLTLLPSTFSTGSYGWKGSKRITVELQGGEVDGENGREKVQIMLSINATVVGSKPTKAAKGKKGKKAQAEEDDAEEDDEEVEEDE